MLILVAVATRDETTELKAANSSNKPRLFTRRRFLEIGVVATLSADAIAQSALEVSSALSIGQKAIDFLLDSPKNPVSTFNYRSIIYPGAIEDRVSSPFIQKEQGHFPWLLEALTLNPQLLQLTQEYYRFLYPYWRDSKRIKLGTAMEMAVSVANKFADSQSGVEFGNYSFNPNIEIGHIAAFLFSSGFTPWFGLETLKQFGLPEKEVDRYPDSTSFYWDTDGFGRRVFPRLYGTDVSDPIGRPPKYQGEDRTGHFASHFLVAYEYLYSNYHSRFEHESIPNILKLVRGGQRVFRPDRLFKDEALDLLEILGIGYEISGLKDPENRKFWNQNEVFEGILDSMVAADLKANKLGACAGLMLFEAASRDKSPSPLYKELNHRRLENLETNSTLEIDFSPRCQFRSS